MNLKLLSWNVRGLNNPHKRLVVTNLLKKWKCDIVCCLQETKLDSTSSNMVKSIWRSPFTDWVALEAICIARGILLMWDKRVFEKVDFMARRLSVLVILKGVADGFEWICSGIYGPTNGSLRDVLWAKLDIVR